MQDWNLIQKTFSFAPENELNAVKMYLFSIFKGKTAGEGSKLLSLVKSDTKPYNL